MLPGEHAHETSCVNIDVGRPPDPVDIMVAKEACIWVVQKGSRKAVKKACASDDESRRLCMLGIAGIATPPAAVWSRRCTL